MEAIAGLFVAAERRRRKNIEELGDKINILIEMQTQSEERFNEHFSRNEERFARNEERFELMQVAIDRLVGAQARTEEKLQTLLDTFRRKDLGESLA